MPTFLVIVKPVRRLVVAIFPSFRVIANQCSHWRTPGWLLLPCGQFTFWQSLIAMALAQDPDLLIADEPTTALDVTTQKEVLDLVNEVADDRKTAVLLITHNLGLVAQYSKYVNVMYAGEIIERGTVPEVLGSPIHPYTQGLIAAVPRLDLPKDSPLVGIEGTVPPPTAWPSGCAFHPRCPKATEECSKAVAKSCMSALR